MGCGLFFSSSVGLDTLLVMCVYYTYKPNQFSSLAMGSSYLFHTILSQAFSMRAFNLSAVSNPILTINLDRSQMVARGIFILSKYRPPSVLNCGF